MFETYETYELSRRAPRLRANRLTLCLSAVLLSQMSAEVALAKSPVATSPRPAIENRATPVKHNPNLPAASPWQVKNCSDHDPDSLRDVIENQAQSGDTVDLSQLPTLCGTTNSTITLTSGEIVVAKNDLKLIGPDSTSGTVTVSGGGAYRVFHHTGLGTLSLDSVTVADGSYHGNIAQASGGCIESDFGHIYLYRTSVTGCTVLSDGTSARGGGISADAGNVTLYFSTVSGNQANSATVGAFGGGVYAAGTLSAKYSSISNNAEHDGPGKAGAGGGAFAETTTILASTIDNNSAAYSSGLNVVAGSLQIWDSTISHNSASVNGAIYCFDCSAATIANSTIAFNHQTSSVSSGALVFYGSLPNSALILQSSIIANNTLGVGNIPADLYIPIGHGVLSGTGTANLVIASNIASPPPGVITVTTDPKLGALQFNGGRTRTHALLPGSPALGMGNNNASLSNDQRGTGYPRTTGPMQTVDIGAFQFDSIFADAFDSQ